MSGLSSIICLVELGGIETQKLVQDVRLDRWRPWIQRCVSDGYACVRLVVCILCNEVCNAWGRPGGSTRRSLELWPPHHPTIPQHVRR